MSWLTVQETATTLGVSAGTVRRWLEAGEFPTARRDGDGLSGPWLIPSDALDTDGEENRGVENPEIVVDGYPANKWHVDRMDWKYGDLPYDEVLEPPEVFPVDIDALAESERAEE